MARAPARADLSTLLQEQRAQLQDRALRLDRGRQIGMHVLRVEVRRLFGRFPDFERSPPLAGVSATDRDEPSRLLNNRTKLPEDLVPPCLGLTVDACRYQYRHSGLLAGSSIGAVSAPLICKITHNHCARMHNMDW